jgi:hypothetical protein
MADKKISALTSASTPLAGTEVLPIVQGGATVKTTVDSLIPSTVARLNQAQTFTGQQTFSNGIITNSIYTDVGSEIIVNGTFDSVTTGWTAANTATLTIVAGGISGNALQVSGTSYGRADQSFTTIVGCKYQVSAYYKNGTTSGIFRVSSAAGGAGDIVDLAVSNANWTQLTTTFTATTTTTFVNLFENASGTMLWDSISVKQFALSIASDAFIAGNLIIGTSGKGIDFSADGQAAGMTSELLDDYEEGTWTPSIGGDATYTTRTGRYTRVGRLVTFMCDLTINVAGTGDKGNISGLPYAASGNNSVYVGYFAGLGASVVSISPFVGGTGIALYGLTAAAGTAAGLNLMGNGARLMCQGSYEV